jgi:hypothetical protein
MKNLFELDSEEYEEAETQEGDEEFGEAERRLSLARYYQQLTKGGLIDEDSEEARQVDSEVRAFARERMNVLIGLAAEKAPETAELPFSEDQVGVLQQWADHMIERAKQPAIRPMAPPPPMKPQVTGPRIKPVAAPPKRKTTKLVGKKPEKPKKTEAPHAGAADLGAVPTPEEQPDYSQIPTGEVFEENGRKYKMVDVPGRIDDNGQQKRAKMDVSEQVRPPNAIPMPRREHMPYVTAQHAAETIDNGVGKSEVALQAAARSMNTE